MGSLVPLEAFLSSARCLNACRSGLPSLTRFRIRSNTPRPGGFGLLMMLTIPACDDEGVLDGRALVD